MAAAQAHISRDILYCDRVGIVGGDIGDRLLHIAGIRGLRRLFCGTLHEQRERRIESAGHLHRLLKFIAAHLVDAEQLMQDLFTEGSCVDIWMLFGKISGI